MVVFQYADWFPLTSLNFLCFSGGRTIIFTETKDSASELSGLIPGSRALHGDVAQAQREVCEFFFDLITLAIIWFSGNTDVAVMLYEPRYKHSVSRLERESRVKFEHISVPQPTDVAQSAGSEAADAIASVSDR